MNMDVIIKFKIRQFVFDKRVYVYISVWKRLHVNSAAALMRANKTLCH